MKKITIFLLALSSFFSADQLYTHKLQGGIGLIQTPTARMMEEGSFSLGYSSFPPYNKYYFYAQPFSWLEGSFFYNDTNTIRYADIDGEGSGGLGIQSHKDKGFNFKLKLLDESRFLPQVAVGMEDFAGTGVWSSEYIVATKLINNFDITLGLGWGKYGTRGSLDLNPLYQLDERFETRGGFQGFGGIPGFNQWFRGPASPFAGIETGYVLRFREQSLDIPLTKKRLRINSFGIPVKFKLDYDPNDHKTDFGGVSRLRDYPPPDSPLSYGVETSLGGLNLGLYHENLNQLSFRWSWSKNFAAPRELPDYKSTKTEFNRETFYLDLLRELGNNGVYVQSANFMGDNHLYVSYNQNIFNSEKEGRIYVDRIVRESFPFVDELTLIPVLNEFTYLSTTNDQDIRYVYQDDQGPRNRETSEHFTPRVEYPVLSYSIVPGFKSHIGAAPKFFFSEINLSIPGAVVLSKNIELGFHYTYPLRDDYETLRYDPVPTDLPPVRIYVAEYLRQGKKGFESLFFQYFKYLGNDVYSAVQVGHLEQMFAGAVGEILYAPYNSRFAVGFEIGDVWQRDFKKSLDTFQDYKTTTHHLSLYYNVPYLNFDFKLSYGRYLARDDGYTFEFSKSFANGTRYGGFFSLTNISTDQFGEGSFDKGVFFFFPTDLLGFSFNKKRSRSKGYNGIVWRPMTRDGASKLERPSELYPLIRQSKVLEFYKD